MYGSIFRLQPRAGREGDTVALFEEWWRERAQRVPGARASYVLRTENGSGELIAVAVFTDREHYRANAADSGQDEWYRRLRETLESDPQWEDGEFVNAIADRGQL